MTYHVKRLWNTFVVAMTMVVLMLEEIDIIVGLGSFVERSDALIGTIR